MIVFNNNEWRIRNVSEAEKERDRVDNRNLNSTVIFVVSEAEGAECAVHTIQTVHVALALV